MMPSTARLVGRQTWQQQEQEHCGESGDWGTSSSTKAQFACGTWTKL